MTSRRTLFAIAAVLLPSVASAQEPGEVVERWLDTNRGIRSLHVEFNQTRKLASLKAPLSERGALWFDHAADRFRWQMGEPAKTIVVRNDDELLIVRPREKKFERREAGEGAMPAMAALAEGFPRDLAAFRRKYRVREVVARGGMHRIVTQPLDQAARGVGTFTFVVGAERFRLHAIEIAFRDGSSQLIEFTKVVPQAPVPASLFEPDLAGYQATRF